MTIKAKAIKLIDFNEEITPSGRKLLHALFKDRYGNFIYRWTPPWRKKGDEFGVENLFFRALQVEEWNDFEGVWSEELRRVAKTIPALEDIKLPVKIELGEVAEEKEGTYKIGVDILTDEKTVWRETRGEEAFLCIGNVKISWELFKQFIFSYGIIKGISKSITELYEDSYSLSPYALRFYLWINKGEEKTQLTTAANDIAFRLRAYIRERLSDYKAIKEGFEPPEEQPPEDELEPF